MGVKTDAAGVRRLVGAYGRADGRSVASVSSMDWSDMSTVYLCVREERRGLVSRGTAIGRIGGRLAQRSRVLHAAFSRGTRCTASMSSSDAEEPARLSEKQRKTLQRREALARLKDASQSRAARQPRFLGADDDDDDADADGGSVTVDFDQWDRQSARRRRAAADSGRNPSRTRSPSPLGDPTLSKAFDDLFDLGQSGDVNDAAGKGEGADDLLDLDGLPNKKRRVVAKLDEERLLGPSGFPLLREHMKKIKIKGKGHEVSLSV